MDIQSFMTKLADCYQNENGMELGRLLRLDRPHGRELLKEFGRRDPSEYAAHDLKKRWKNEIANPWDELGIQYVVVCAHVKRKRVVDAFGEQEVLVRKFFEYFAQNCGWTLPILFSVLEGLMSLAHDGPSFEKVAIMIEEALRLCIADTKSPPEKSRKWGAYAVFALALKSSLRAKRAPLCRAALRTLIKAVDMPPFDVYPRSHRVTYWYYRGKLHFQERDYKQAEESFTKAFYHCHNDATKNKERILLYLIPLRMLKGHLPASELLLRFPDIDEVFTPLVWAIRAGDLKAYDQVLEEGKLRFLPLGLWLVVQRSRDLCLRSLFRKVWLSCGELRIPVTTFQTGLRTIGVDVDVSQVACYVGLMLHKGFMAGHIIHEGNTVTVALQQFDPFPKAAAARPCSVPVTL